MNKTRILIVADAVVLRRSLAEALSANPALEVVGTAATEHIALARIDQVNPDLVLLDTDMPERSGLREAHPHLPMILFSGSASRAGCAGYDAPGRHPDAWGTLADLGTAGDVGQLIRDRLAPEIERACARIDRVSNGRA